MLGSHTTYASVGMGGSLAVLLPWVAKAIFKVEMPPEVAISAATLLSMLVGYFLHKVQTTQVTQGVTK